MVSLSVRCIYIIKTGIKALDNLRQYSKNIFIKRGTGRYRRNGEEHRASLKELLSGRPGEDDPKWGGYPDYGHIGCLPEILWKR